MLNRYKRRLIVPFLAPALLLYGIFYLYPAVRTLLIGFTEWNGVSSDMPFVGLANFQELLGDSFFVDAVANTFEFAIMGAVVLFPIAMFFAFATSDSRLKGGRSMRFMILAPATLSVVTAAVLFKFLLNPNFGLLNGTLRAAGLDGLAQPWLGREAFAMPAVVAATVWHGIGIWVLFFSAAISRVPREVLDAATIDGASRFQTFRLIVLPLIWDVARTLIVLWIIQALQAFAFIIAMTNGGPLRSTEVLATYLYDVTFSQFRFGYGAAVAVMMTALVLLLALIANRVSKREAVVY